MPKHTVISNSPQVESLNRFSEYHSLSLLHVIMCFGPLWRTLVATDLHYLYERGYMYISTCLGFGRLVG